MANIRRIHPGEYIKESLLAMEMTAKEFSARTGISERTLSSIINGNGDITFDVAYKLSSYFDSSITYWTNLQTQYNVYLLEQNKEKELLEEWNLIKPFKKYLLEYDIISNTDKKEVIVSKCRKAAGVTSLLLLNEKDTFVCLKEQQTKKNEDLFSQNFWVALALTEARKKVERAFDKRSLINSLPEIRSMTLQDPEYFYPRLQEIFNECGISFVLLPYLLKSNIYGATKWIGKNNVMLAISNRGGKADSFWFTLFHEISHVLMEHKREMLIYMKGDEDVEANEIAANILIPKKEWENFTKNDNYSKERISEFSKKIGIHPCIVVGRLYKEKRLSYGTYNRTFGLEYEITKG